ncbi:hypothetical protein D3C85_1449140 [compost metagenome]
MECAGIDVVQGHRAAPDAAGVQGNDPGLLAAAFKRRPVAEDDLHMPRATALVGEPGLVARRGGIGAFLALEVELAFAGAKAHAGEVIGDNPQAGDAAEVLAPLVRLVAVHAVEVGL